jgi:hypothetical protein
LVYQQISTKPFKKVSINLNKNNVPIFIINLIYFEREGAKEDVEAKIRTICSKL